MTVLAYTPDENINRIMMDRNTKYLVLEGVDDIPKYESAIKQIDVELDFQPIALGCKNKVLSLLSQVRNTNFVAIVDLDFDQVQMPTDSRLLTLKRYSIENYLISSTIINSFVGSLTNVPKNEVPLWLTINEWVSHTHEKLKGLIKTLHYYQTQVNTDRLSWNSVDLTTNGGWYFCDQKINNLILSLFNNNIPATLAQYETYPALNEYDIIKYFPGKLLIKSLYSYLKEKFNQHFGKPKKLTSVCTNHMSFTTFISAFLSLDGELRSILIAGIDQLKPV